MTQPIDSNPYEPPESSDRSSKNPTRSNAARTSKSTTEKLVVLATFDTPVRAHLLRIELGDNGINARVGNETTTATFGATIAGPSSAFWIEVLVLESDADKALEIKNRWLASERDDDEVDIPEWTCDCGETVDAGFSVCWNCDADYSGSVG